MRFTIDGGGVGNSYTVNGTGSIAGLAGIYTISGGGSIGSYQNTGDTYVISASGISVLEEKVSAAAAGVVTVRGTGSGHNVGMSQFGAKAMAELGYTFEDILYFYFTGINLERVGFYF